MKIRGKFITPILTVLSVAALSGILILVYVFSAVLDQQTQHSDAIADDMFVRSARTQAAEVGHAIDSIANNALVQATIFAQMPEVQSAYQLALTGNMDDEFDPTVQAARQQLRSGIKDAVQGYQQLLETNDLRLHFHLPNSRSFVRS